MARILVATVRLYKVRKLQYVAYRFLAMQLAVLSGYIIYFLLNFNTLLNDCRLPLGCGMAYVGVPQCYAGLPYRR
jgi:hypothetical protein